LQVLVEIFDYLPLEDLFPASLVCQLWYEIVNTSVLRLKTAIRIDKWNHKDLVACSTKCDKKYVDTTFTPNYWYGRQQLTNCDDLPGSRAKMYDFVMQNFSINHEILEQLNMPYTKDVKTLVFDNVKLTLKVDEFLKFIGNLKNLKTLHLLDVDLMEIDWAEFTKLPDECSIELDILEYFYSYGLNYNQFHNANLLPLFLYFFKRIKKLSLNMEWYWGDKRQLDFLKICKEKAEFINLYELNIRTDSREETESVTNYLPLIEDLNVRELTVRRDFDSYVEEDSVFVRSDFKILPTLEKLNIREIICTAEEIQIIVAHAPNLLELHIGIDTGSNDVPVIFENLKNLKRLKKLGLNHGKQHIPKPAVLKINALLEMEQMEFLCFGGEVPILYLDVATLPAKNCLGNLKTFQLDITRNYKVEKRFDKITEVTLKYMLGKMENLEELFFDVSICIFIYF
jgi:F-box-like